MVVPKIYVCMTSIPFRYKRLPFVIDSLLKNNILPDKIIVNLCENYERFPEDKFDISVLNKYKNNDLITINNNCKDYGPGTKILGCLDNLLETEKDIENVYLLTADDDLLYKPTFIEEFKRCILLDSTKSYTGYQSNRGLKINNIPFYVSFGADGISFKLSQLKKLKNFCLKLFETDIKFKFHDDFCFTCYFNLNNIIMNTMSYSKVKLNGFPDMGEFQMAYHIVREADLLAAYDFDRCMVYDMYKKGSNVDEAYEHAKNLFYNRVFKHYSDGLLITDYSQTQHFILKPLVHQRMRSWNQILKYNK